MTELVVHADPEALAAAAADAIAAELRRAIAARGICHIALAGGRTPRSIYERLAEAPDLDWERVVVLFGDERCVPPEDAASNYRMADEALLSRLATRPRVARILGERGPFEAADDYSEVVAAAEPLDLVLLGMGEDGHVASIFPGTPEPYEGAIAIATTSPIPPADRVSLTLEVIGRARVVMVFVTGAGKTERLAEVWRQRAAGEVGAAGDRLPAARVGASERLCWHIDEAAAARLPEGAR